MWQVILSDAPSCQLKTLNLQTPESLFTPPCAVSWAPWGGWTTQPCGSAGQSRRGCSCGFKLYINVYGFPRLRFYVAPRATVLGPPGWSDFCRSPLHLHPLDCSQHPLQSTRRSRPYRSCILCICRSSAMWAAWIRSRVFICAFYSDGILNGNAAVTQRENSRELWISLAYPVEFGLVNASDETNPMNHPKAGSNWVWNCQEPGRGSVTNCQNKEPVTHRAL